MEKEETTSQELPAIIDTKAFADARLKEVKAAGGTKAFYARHSCFAAFGAIK